jgi:putative methyltransferase (TIGR04325 family)
VDFGGSSGWCYDYLKHTLTSRAIDSYVIVEIDRVVEYMNGSGLHQPPVRYVTADARLEKCDVLYSNSVLQYCDSNAQLLDLVERTGPQYVLLDDLAARGDEDFFSTQAYYDTTIPTRFLGWTRLMSDLSGAGYANTLAAPYPAAIHGKIQPLPMDNFPEEYRIRHSWSLLFSRAPGR